MLISNLAPVCVNILASHSSFISQTSVNTLLEACTLDGDLLPRVMFGLSFQYQPRKFINKAQFICHDVTAFSSLPNLNNYTRSFTITPIRIDVA